MAAFYRYLLHCYPADHLREYGEEMLAVFRQAHEAVSSQGVRGRTLFYSREITGVLVGALREQLCADWSLLRRLDMRSEYRFPRSAIFLMVVLLVAVVVAIESARSISAGETNTISGWVILRLFVFGASFMCVTGAITGAIGYAILSVLRRTGVDRLANIQTWLRQR
jgi:hypothetical protein